MFNNPRIDKLYELMTRLNCVQQTGSTELLVNAKKYLATNATFRSISLTRKTGAF